MRTSIRWKLFRIWCDIGWAICPPEHRKPLDEYMRDGRDEEWSKWERAEAFLGGQIRKDKGK